MQPVTPMNPNSKFIVVDGERQQQLSFGPCLNKGLVRNGDSDVSDGEPHYSIRSLYCSTPIGATWRCETSVS